MIVIWEIVCCGYASIKGEQEDRADVYTPLIPLLRLLACLRDGTLSLRGWKKRKCRIMLVLLENTEV